MDRVGKKGQLEGRIALGDQRSEVLRVKLLEMIRRNTRARERGRKREIQGRERRRESQKGIRLGSRGERGRGD